MNNELLDAAKRALELLEAIEKNGGLKQGGEQCPNILCVEEMAIELKDSIAKLEPAPDPPLEALKDCPMCGAPAKMVRVGGEYFPMCTGTSKRGMCLLNRIPYPGHDGFTYEKDAIRVWNIRPIDMKDCVKTAEGVWYCKHARPGTNVGCSIGADGGCPDLLMDSACRVINADDVEWLSKSPFGVDLLSQAMKAREARRKAKGK